MNPFENQLGVQILLIATLNVELECLVSHLEAALPHIYSDEEEAADSDEALAIECAREVLAWVQGGKLPFWYDVH